MVSLSADFYALAKANGRSPYCIIHAGDMVLTDREILSFELNDIVHNEEMELGSVCSNRFHFELESDSFIPLSAVIRPYVGFEGSDELCPLGEFYITRRYRSHNRYSVTCYDKMYRLEDIYVSQLSFPVSAELLLSELCNINGITKTFVSKDYMISSIPANVTTRDLLGYIAGINGGCAKFDRFGRLCLKQLTNCGEVLTRDDYTDCWVKADPLEVRRIEMVTPSGIIGRGNGTKLTTYRQENPLASEEAVLQVYQALNGFVYYGADVTLHGLPYLEAGDSVYLQNDRDNTLYPILLSEINYTYNGGLWATIHSKSKNPVDEYEPQDKDALTIQTIYHNLSLAYFSGKNQSEKTITTKLTLLADVDFHTISTTSVLYHAQLNVIPVNNCVLELVYRLNGVTLPFSSSVSLKEGETALLCLHQILETVHVGVNRLSVYAKTDNGSVIVPALGYLATVTGQFLQGESGGTPEVYAADTVPSIPVISGNIPVLFGTGYPVISVEAK